MHTFKNAMPRFIDPRHSASGRRAPHQKDNPPGPLFGHDVDDLLGEFLPPLFRVAVGLLGAHGQHRVEQQDALLGPRHEQAAVVRRRLEVRVILRERDEHVLQRGRRDPSANGKTKPVGLVDVDVGILPDDNRFHRIKRRVFRPRT